MQHGHSPAPASVEDTADVSGHDGAELDAPGTVGDGGETAGDVIDDEGSGTTAGDLDHSGSGGAEGDRGLAEWLAWNGCPGDRVVVLVGHPDAPPPPMSTPAGMGGLIVSMVQLHAEHDDQVQAFVAGWEPDPRTEGRVLGGEVYVELSPAATTRHRTADQRVDVRMLLAAWGRWHLVGRWYGLGQEWPQVIAPTAALVMRLHNSEDPT